MKVRVIDKPCLFAETVYLLYYYINGIAYTRDYERVNRKFGRYLLEKEDQGLQLAQGAGSYLRSRHADARPASGAAALFF